MSYIKPLLVNDEIYHVVSRAVGDTVIFVDESDFYRGIFSIYEFNNSKKVEIWERRRARNRFKKQERESVGRPTSHLSEYIDERDKLVDVLAFSFMPNHLHLIVKQLEDNGITEFMKKVNGGYAKYFNKKYQRMGHLFNKFRAVHIKDDDQLRNAFLYVHANLISIIEPGWKEKGIKNPKKVKEFLENNKRHSYVDYLGKKTFPSVTQRDFFLEFMGGPVGCRAGIDGWIKNKNKLPDLEKLALE
ncbi:MAG: transposase [Candidatus Staskawiczbacteria bacterium]|nr:transposase [Candidatus Staskawiczbacteria bacterium]